MFSEKLLLKRIQEQIERQKTTIQHYDNKTVGEININDILKVEVSHAKLLLLQDFKREIENDDFQE